jgi:hypothetical protein
MAEASLAMVFLRLAGDDSRACRTLAADPQVSDAIGGFHAHQSIEKSLKAVLAAASVDFRHTQDLAELLDRLTDEGLPLPPHAEHLDELNPYAVQARYGLVDPPPLDRAATLATLADVLGWAGRLVPVT